MPRQQHHKRVTIGTLSKYASALGQGSLAYDAMQEFKRWDKLGVKVEILMVTTGFLLRLPAGDTLRFA